LKAKKGAFSLVSWADTTRGIHLDVLLLSGDGALQSKKLLQTSDKCHIVTSVMVDASSKHSQCPLARAGSEREKDTDISYRFTRKFCGAHLFFEVC